MVGLLLFGVALGPHVLGFFGEHRPIADFFAELGKLLLMFSAGLEIDIALFRKAQARSIIFGLFTTTVPLLFGTLLGLGFGYALIPAIVVGSLLASHTLLSVPIVQRLGVIRLEPIVVTIGATVLSDTLSLIVFAVCVSMYTTGFSPKGLAIQLIEIAIFVPLILIGLSRAGAWALSRMGSDEEAHFLLMLAVMAVAGAIAGFINLPGIVGAFLAGLAVNSAVQDDPGRIVEGVEHSAGDVGPDEDAGLDLGVAQQRLEGLVALYGAPHENHAVGGMVPKGSLPMARTASCALTGPGSTWDITGRI